MAPYDRNYAADYDYDDLWPRRRRMRPPRLGPFGWEPFGHTANARRQGYGELEETFDDLGEFRPCLGRPRRLARDRGEFRRPGHRDGMRPPDRFGRDVRQARWETDYGSHFRYRQPGPPIRMTHREWRDHASEYDRPWREYTSDYDDRRRGRSYARGAGRRWGKRARPARPDRR